MAAPSSRGVAVVTGASSGIGEASARALSAEDFRVVLGARREERLAAVCEELGDNASYGVLDVTSGESVTRFCEMVRTLGPVRVLVNNAGGALGLEPVAEADEEHWQQMYETNVLGAMRMTKALRSSLISSGDGHVVTIGSVAAFEPYAGGAGYNAAKAGARALMDVLRIENLGEPLRFTEIDPGLVETEFSLVRFDGDVERADNVYAEMTPLRAEDIAACVVFAVTRPSHVNLDQIVVRPRDQARVGLVHRTSPH